MGSSRRSHGRFATNARVAVLCAVALCGCSGSSEMPPDASTVPGDGGQPRAVDLDILFVVDNSSSTYEWQERLAQQVPWMLGSLMSGNVGSDSTIDFAPFSSVQFGIVTIDMGSGGFPVPTCSDPMFGDDALLRAEAAEALPECVTEYASITVLDSRELLDIRVAGHTYACMGRIGVDGCGFEQPLEAALKALTPSTSPIRFFGDTGGHGDGANAGLVRASSILAIVLLVDEDDCSAADPSLYDLDDPAFGDPDLRCVQHPEALHSIERYADGFLALRPGRPDTLLFAAIAGIPVDLVRNPDDVDFDALLADPRIQNPIDPDTGRLETSCTLTGAGVTYPPPRIVELARALRARGARSTVQSLCTPDLRPAVDAIARLAGQR